MLPNTITLNVGTPAADVVYDTVENGGGTQTYYAASPQGDLEGRPSITFGTTRLKSGIMRTVALLKWPIWSASAGKYTGFDSANVVLVRPASSPVALSNIALESASKLIAVAAVKSSMVNGTL